MQPDVIDYGEVLEPAPLPRSTPAPQHPTAEPPTTSGHAAESSHAPANAQPERLSSESHVANAPTSHLNALDRVFDEYRDHPLAPALHAALREAVVLERRVAVQLRAAADIVADVNHGWATVLREQAQSAETRAKNRIDAGALVLAEACDGRR